MSKKRVGKSVSGLASRDKRALVEGILPMIRSIAEGIYNSNHWIHRWITLADLEQEGALGALEAARLYDPDRGIAFTTFAYPRIEGKMQDTFRRRNYKTIALVTYFGNAAMTRDRQVADQEPSIEQILIARSEQGAIDDAIESLPDQEKAAVARHYRQEVPQRELCRHMGLRRSRVSEIVHEGLHMAQRHLRKQGIGPSILNRVPDNTLRLCA